MLCFFERCINCLLFSDYWYYVKLNNISAIFVMMRNKMFQWRLNCCIHPILLLIYNIAMSYVYVNISDTITGLAALIFVTIVSSSSALAAVLLLPEDRNYRKYELWTVVVYFSLSYIVIIFFLMPFHVETMRMLSH